MVVSNRNWSDKGVFTELRMCPELVARPAIRDALAEVDAAIARALQAAAVETRDEVAAWLAYSMAYALLDQLADVLVFAGVIPEERRYQRDATTAAEWMAQFESFAASGRAWEMREVSS